MAILTDELGNILTDELGNILTDEFGLLADVTLTLTQTNGGVASVDTPGPVYAEGTPLVFLATPNSDYRFVTWLLNDQSFPINPLNVNIQQDLTALAIFSLIVPPVISTNRARCPFCVGGRRCPICGGSGWIRG